TVINVNDRPTATATTLTATTEDLSSPAGATVAALGFGYNDRTDNQGADTGNAYANAGAAVTGGSNTATAFGGLAIVGNAANATTQGVWQYTTNGTDWVTIGGVNVGSVPSDTAALLLPTTASLRFLPNVLQYNGTPGSLTVRVADTAVAFSASSDIHSNLTSTDQWSSSTTLGTSVTAVNDAPTIGALDATSVNTPLATPYVQAGTAVVIDPNATLADQELVTERNSWDRATLTISRHTAASADDVFDASGNLDSLSVASGNVVLSSTTIGTYTRSGGVLTITFNTNATSDRVNEALQSITYSNAVTTPGGLNYNSVTLDVTINDQNSNITGGGTVGTGQDQGNGGRLSATGSIVINIDRLPIANADTVSVSEGVTTADSSVVSGDVVPGSTSGGNVLDTDQDSDTLTVDSIKPSASAVATVTAGSTSASNATSVSGSYGGLVIGADGSYTYTLDNTKAAVQALAVSETLTDTFTYTIKDGRGGSSSSTLTVTITGTNDAPILDSTPALSITQTEDAATPSGAVGTLVSILVSRGSSSISDLDTSNPIGIAITATDSNRGTWWYSTAATPSWTSFTATDTTARLLLADANTRIYFQPTANWQGSVTSALTIRAWDKSSGINGGTADVNTIGTGGTTAFSTATDTVDLTVTSVNDQPTTTSNVTLSAFTEDVSTPSGATLSGLSFGYSDVADDQNGSNTATLLGGDTSTSFTYLAVVGSSSYTAAQGVWQISKTSTPNASTASDWINIPVSGITSSAALIFRSDSQVRFVAAANYFGTPGTLTVRLADASVDLSARVATSNSTTFSLTTYGGTGTTGAWSAVDRTIGTTVTNVND
ncbi:MAG: VCBS domain-containing protein, partial [Holophagaceae bacterium]